MSLVLTETFHRCGYNERIPVPSVGSVQAFKPLEEKPKLNLAGNLEGFVEGNRFKAEFIVVQKF